MVMVNPIALDSPYGGGGDDRPPDAKRHRGEARDPSLLTSIGKIAVF